MKFSSVLLVCCLSALVCLTVASSADPIEWIQPAFIEAELPSPGQPCGAGGVCSARPEWCGQKTVVHGLCGGTAICCVPKAAPARAAPVAPAPLPVPRPNIAVTDATRVAPVISPVLPVGPAAGADSGLPVDDLSPSEEAVDGATPDTPLDSAANAGVAAADAASRATRDPNVPPLPYDLTGFFADDRVSLNGVLQPAGAGPQVGGGRRAPARPGVIPAVGTAPGVCGAYANSPVTKMTGNAGVVYEVVKILPQHADDPSMLRAAPTARDNTMRTSTACAFDKMHNAALKDGINIKIASGFRTLARQQYFWNCFKTKKCNKGRRGAPPGSSNHGRGLALDLNQAQPGVYNWLARNAHSFGFVRTVPTERWHWEYRPGTPKARYT